MIFIQFAHSTKKMTDLFMFALVKITEGHFQGRTGRLYDKPTHGVAPRASFVQIVSDHSLGEMNIMPELLQRPDGSHDTFHIFPTRVVKFMEMSQPSNEFMIGHAKRFREIILDEMKKSLEKELILERISTLGELFDLVTLQGGGWQPAFWERYVRIFGPKYKKKPKSARHLA